MSILIIDPTLFPQVYDKFQVGGVFSPGVIPVDGISGFERKYEFDRKKGKGAFGETITFTQKPSAEGKIKIHIGYMRNGLSDISKQFQALADFIPMLRYDPTKTAIQAIDIYHPSLAICQISSVLCDSVSPLRRIGKGVWEVEFSFLEFNPPPQASAVSTPNTSQTGAGTAGEAAAISQGAPLFKSLPASELLKQQNAALLAKAEQP